MTRKDIFYILGEKKGLLLIIVAGVFSISFLLALIMPPVYEARAKLLLINDTRDDTQRFASYVDMLSKAVGKSDPITTYMEIMKTNPVYLETSKRLQQLGYPHEKYSPAYLEKNIGTSLIRNSNIILISLRDRKPKAAMDVVNTYAKVFIDRNQQINQEEMDSMHTFIEQQLTMQNKKVFAATGKLIDFKEKQKYTPVTQEAKIQENSLQNLESERLRIQAQLQGMHAQVNELQAKTNAPAAQSDPNYPNWINALDQAKSQVTTLQGQLRATENQIANVSANMLDMNATDAELSRLMQDEKIANDLYNLLLSKYDEMEVARLNKIASIKIIDPALLPENPVGPRRILIVILGTLFSFFSVCGVILLLHRMKESPTDAVVRKEG